ncbi:hypothetical protein VP01_249g9 [Puccinia sorghi]|uniref:Uncharacterized protein n=1 Tax=Puccinia sorghi TaxID=27349 RepID=A0A0L6V5V4_9BASI|nr:hypothetical protein VP01_249g9 [Puccinia sorghi]
MNATSPLSPANSPPSSSPIPDEVEPTDQPLSDLAPEIELPSLIFAIPFPRAAAGYQTTKDTPPFLLYTFPRSVYQRPPKDPVTGKRKEKLLKKVERKWQEEVKESEDIKRGEAKEAGVWSRFKGALIRVSLFHILIAILSHPAFFHPRDASAAIKYMPNNAIEVLGRLPPKTKLGKLTIVYPVSSESSLGFDVSYPSEDEIEDNFLSLLSKACKKARAQTLIWSISSLDLAVCCQSLWPCKSTLISFLLVLHVLRNFFFLNSDVFVVVPLFLFEINLAYFSVQATGAQKARLLSHVEKKKKCKGSMDPSLQSSGNDEHEGVQMEEQQIEEEQEDSGFGYEVAKAGAFDQTIAHLYNICYELDPLKFPLKDGLPIPMYLPSQHIASSLVDIFKQSLPPEVMARHVLDHQLAAEDLDRALRKAAKEYLKTIKTINDTSSCFLHDL